MHNTINRINTAVCCVRKSLRVDPNSSQHEDTYFSYFFSFVSLWDDGCSLNLLGSALHDACRSHHYAVHLTLHGAVC